MSSAFEDIRSSESNSDYKGGRARSNSTTKKDAILNGSAPMAVILNDSGAGTTERLEVKIERTNLNERELKQLRKGLDDATLLRDRDSIREEEEEKRAADAERKIRNAATLPSKIGIEPPLRKFKILMLGDSGVGKSSLINRWTVDTFTPTLVGTVGVDFKLKKVQLGSESINVQVWDTAGQEQFHKITTSYYRNANGIMLVYDISDQASYSNVEYWITNIKKYALEHVHIALIGNKVDLRIPEGTAVAFEQGNALATKFDVPYFETSAKDATNVESAFQTVVASIMDSERKKDVMTSPVKGRSAPSSKTIQQKADDQKGSKPDDKCRIS